MADHLAVLNMPVEALKRSHTVTSFDPLTLLPALAVQTKHLGLIATASTTFEPPYMIARRFASLDHISGGRAGWNIVTTSNPDAALNFGLDEHMEHDERYARAREFYDVVTGPVGFLRRRRLRARCRERPVLRAREDARAQSQGALSLGARPAQHRAAGAGLAGDRAGGRLRSGAAAWRRRRRNSCSRRAAGWRTIRRSTPT